MANNQKRIELLDCTLRDGGHINQGHFGKKVIKAIIEKLVKANTDIIEAGFLWDQPTSADVARFDSIDKLKAYLPEDMGNSKISLMADNVDLSGLADYDGTVDIIRLSFRKEELDWAKRNAKILEAKGYKYYINPIHGSAISDYEYLKFIDEVNELKPYGFSIVDSFGAMRQRDLKRVHSLIENNLDRDIVLGVHLHENLGLSFALAQDFINDSSPNRRITVDGSLYGMGKVPGNLCIEQVMDYMNTEYEADYHLEPVYDAIDDYIMPIRKKVVWGYTIPYAISAQCGVHRTYAEFFSGKNKLRTVDIKHLMAKIDSSHAQTFDEKYAQNLYDEYMNISYDDETMLENLKDFLAGYEGIVVFAPGASIKDMDLPTGYFKNKCLIDVNFKFSKYEPTLCFFTNAKRIEECKWVESDKLIISSNLLSDYDNSEYVISRQRLIEHDGIICDDSTLMLINLLKQLGIKKVEIAGFDGFDKNADNFYEKAFDRVLEEYDFHHEHRKNVFDKCYKSQMEIKFLTPSVYDKE